METAVNPTPEHVPDDLVVQFDYYDIPDTEEDVQLAWRRVQQENPDIFWTPHNGGHWVATRAADIETIQTDWERFSNSNYVIPKTTRRFRPLPLGVDPPEHRQYRSLITPALSPKGVRAVTDHARTVAAGLIDQLRPNGQCEFVTEFAQVLPIVVFLGIVDLPEEDRGDLLRRVEGLIRGRTAEERNASLAMIAEYLQSWITARTENPGEDLISHIATAQVDGRAMTEDEVFGLTMLVMAGGLDTVAAMLAFFARFLALNPQHRRQLIDDPELIPVAIDEILRRHGIIATAREISHDFEYKGVQFKAGEMIQIPNLLYGLDERRVDRPLEVDFHRQGPIPHAAFGNGTHKCPGANLARQEIRIFLEEWLARIPDFEIRPGTKPQQVTAQVSGVLSLQLQWDPNRA